MEKKTIEMRFNEDMKQIDNLLYLEDSREDSICGVLRGAISDDFYDWRADEFVYDEETIFYAVYDFVNYDFIAINKNGVDVPNSNHKDIAKIWVKWATPKICQEIMERLY